MCWCGARERERGRGQDSCIECIIFIFLKYFLHTRRRVFTEYFYTLKKFLRNRSYENWSLCISSMIVKIVPYHLRTYDNIRIYFRGYFLCAHDVRSVMKYSYKIYVWTFVQSSVLYIIRRRLYAYFLFYMRWIFQKNVSVSLTTSIVLSTS